MKTPVDRAYAAQRMVADLRDTFRSVEYGGRGEIDLGRDGLGRRLKLVRAPQYAEAYPDCLQPAIQLWLRVEDAAGRDVTPPTLNPIYVVGHDCSGDAYEWLRYVARAAVLTPGEKHEVRRI